MFGPTPTAERFLSSVEAVEIVTHESNSILRKRVVGKEDVDIAAMIRTLRNSDWVREGRHFYDANDMVCPFCQQMTEEAFAQSLNEYFDDTFETDSKAIDTLVVKYKTDSGRIQQQVASAIAAPTGFLDVEKLKAESDLLDSKIVINDQRLASKKREPSQVVELESISSVVSGIVRLIESANTLIADHNRMVVNLSQERSELTEQVWKYLLERELRTDLDNYEAKRNGLGRAVAAISKKFQRQRRTRRKRLTKSGASKSRRPASSQRLTKLTPFYRPLASKVSPLPGRTAARATN